MVRYTCLETAWGPLAFAATDAGVCGLILPMTSQQAVEQEIGRRWPGAERHDRLMPEIRKRAVAYFAGERVVFEAPLDLSGLSDFAQSVLRRCQAIPYGETCTYGQLAEAVGRTGAARAVGGVMARNPIPLIIPCHRVLARGGGLCGFSGSGGLKTKARMLELEGRGSRR